MGNVCIDAHLCIYVYMNKYLTCVLCVYKMCSDWDYSRLRVKADLDFKGIYQMFNQWTILKKKMKCFGFLREIYCQPQLCKVVVRKIRHMVSLNLMKTESRAKGSVPVGILLSLVPELSERLSRYLQAEHFTTIVMGSGSVHLEFGPQHLCREICALWSHT